jgi:hypothetical protein
MFNDHKYGSNWMNLLTNRDFQYGDKHYRYSVGQPMGAYTSWAAFTLTHHLVVHWAAYLCGLSDFKDYIILGDDIVIKDNRVARKYITLMTRFGVDISPTKTHVSLDTYEFAKRWISKGREISGLSLKGIIGNIKSTHVVYMNIFNYFQRKPSMHVSLLHLMGELYKGLRIGNRIKSKNTIYNNLYDFHHAIRWSFGFSNYEELRNYFIKKIPIDEFIVPSERIISFKIKEILSLGMVSQGLAMKRSLLKAFGSFDSNPLPKEFWPLKYGYLNHIDSLKEKITKFSDNEYNLLDLITVFRVQSLDPILNFQRNSYKNLIVLDKLWNSSFKEYIKKLNEELVSEDKPKMDLMSHIRSGNFLKTTYKTTLVNLKPWNETLNETLDRVKFEFNFDDLKLKSNTQNNQLSYQDKWTKYFIDSSIKRTKPRFDIDINSLYKC